MSKPYRTIIRLRGGEGSLSRFETLIPDWAARAEQKAAVFVATHFRRWSTALWNEQTAPVEVAEVARYVAESEYLRLDAAMGSPLGAPPPAAQALYEMAIQLTNAYVATGRLTAPDGQTVEPISPTGLHGEIER